MWNKMKRVIEIIDTIVGWIAFVLIQLISLMCGIIGLIILVIPCIRKSWTQVTQIYQPDWSVNAGLPKKLINVWSSKWLNPIWGNNEDGVTDTRTLTATQSSTVWNAYQWSALRNPASNLRFVFRYMNAPFYRWENKAKTWYFQCGWYPNGFPVLSAGKI